MNLRSSRKGGGSCRVEGGFFCVNASVGGMCVCICVLKSVLSHIQDWSVVTAAPELQVSLCPVDCEPPLFPRKMLSTRVGLPQSSTDIWETPGMSLAIKEQHLDIFISAIKKGTIRGKRGSKCKDRLRKEKERVGIEGREGMSAPAKATCAAKGKNSRKKNDEVWFYSSPWIIFNKPFNKREWPLLTPTLHLVVIVGGSTLPGLETEKAPGTYEGKCVNWSLKKPQCYNHSLHLVIVILIWN